SRGWALGASRRGGFLAPQLPPQHRMDQKKAEELIRRLAAALRGTELYSPSHPLVQRGIDAFTTAATERLQSSPSVVIGFIGVEEVSDEQAGIAAARRVYSAAVETAESLWNAAKAGDQPDPAAARKIIDGLARLVTQDRTSLMALTALKKYDNYTFTHMVNVSALAMAQARALNIEGP